jgi:hypothetical protein
MRQFWQARRKRSSHCAHAGLPSQCTRAVLKVRTRQSMAGPTVMRLAGSAAQAGACRRTQAGARRRRTGRSPPRTGLPARSLRRRAPPPGCQGAARARRPPAEHAPGSRREGACQVNAQQPGRIEGVVQPAHVTGCLQECACSQRRAGGGRAARRLFPPVAGWAASPGRGAQACRMGPPVLERFEDGRAQRQGAPPSAASATAEQRPPG